MFYLDCFKFWSLQPNIFKYSSLLKDVHFCQWIMMMNDEMNTEAHVYTLLTSYQWRTDQNGCSLHNGIFHPLITPPPPFFYFFISTRQNFLQARIHTSHLHTGARKCIPAARVAIWWQAVGGREDELCQWQPLKRTTHSPVAGEAWWMIISRCDRCGIGGGALTFHPFLPSAPRLSFSHLAYISDSALTLH